MSNFIAYDEEFIVLADVGKEMDIINRYFRIGYFNIKGYNAFDIAELKGEDLVKPNILKFEDINQAK